MAVQFLDMFEICISTSLLIGSCQRIANKLINVSVGGTLLTTASSGHYLGITVDPTLLEFA